MQKIIIFLLCLYFHCEITAQSEIPIGEWKSHMSLKEGLHVTQNEEKIIYTGYQGLLFIDKEDLSVSSLSKEDGLSGVDIEKMVYDDLNKQLIIVYKDSNIDILNDDIVINISSIRDNRIILGSKKINDIEIVDKNRCFFSTDFGIVGFDLIAKEFLNTTFTPFRINDITSFNNKLYAATEKGIFTISLNDSNLADFNRWKLLATDSNLPEVYEASQIISYFDALYVNINNNLFKSGFDEDFDLFYTPESNFQIIFLTNENANLLIGIRNFNNNRSKMNYVNAEQILKAGTEDCVSRMTYGIEDQFGRVWYGDEWSPIKYTEAKEFGCRKLDYNSPAANRAGEIFFKNKTAYIASGGITEDYGNPENSFGFYIYENQFWNNYNFDEIPLMAEKELVYQQVVVPNTSNDEIYLGSYWNGIMIYDTKTKVAAHFNKDNTNGILQGRVGDPLRTRIPYMILDDDENLWISNFGAPRPLVVRTKDNKWFNFSLNGNNNISKIAIDENNNKWMTIQGVGNGVVVYNDGQTFDDTSDDKIRYITSSNSEISANKVNSILVDLNGSVWVGTSEGPVIFDCPDPFSSSCTGTTRKVIEDGIPAILLKTEDILSIVADGANRKWLGTRNGIFVMSPSGDTLITKYDVKNSPLLDNTVRTLSFNGVTGEMWIVTNLGIQSFRTTTTLGRKTHSDVYVFPNPVRPDFQGTIAINGLVRDADVKITDISGRLVYETKAEGGQATWNGRDYNGIKVASGVYLVFSTSESLTSVPDAYVTKILFMN